MGWGWLFKRKRRPGADGNPHKRRGRPTKAMVAERRTHKIQELKDQILEAKLQSQLDALKNGGSDGAYSLRIDDIPRIQRQLQRVGIDIDLRGGDEGAEQKGWLQELLRSDEGRTLVLLAAQRFLGGPAALTAPPAAQQIPAATAPVTAVEPAQQPPAADPNVGLSEALISGLGGKAPAAAAAWLIEWAGHLVGFAVWLNEPARADWAVETATELRQQLATRTGLA